MEREEKKKINVDEPVGEEIVKPEPGLQNEKIKLEKGEKISVINKTRDIDSHYFMEF